MARYPLFVLLVLLSVVTANTQTTFDRLTDNGYAELEAGNATASKRILEQALRILPEHLSLDDQSIFYNNLGVAYYQSGEYKKGIDQYKHALNIYMQMGNDSLVAGALHNLGLSYKEIGLYGLAMETLIRSARIFERLGNRKELASAWNAIGNIQRELGNFEKALVYHQRALRIRREIGYDKGIADSYHNIGYIYLDQKKYDQAEYYLEEALHLKKLLGNEANQLTTLTLLGEIYLQQKDHQKAYEFLEAAYNLRLVSGSSAKTAFSLYHLGMYYAQIGQRSKAYTAYRQSQELARSSEDYPLLADALFGEIHLLRQDGNTTLLIERYEALLATREQLAHDANRKELAKLEIAYDVERKNHELEARRKQSKLDGVNIENHRLRNQKLAIGLVLSCLILVTISTALIRLRQRKKQIERKNEEIMHLHHELSHRTKNYFGLLSGILKSDRSHMKQEEAIQVLNDNIRRLEAMSLVQSYLLDDSTRRNKEVQLDAYLGHIIKLVTQNLFPQGDRLKLVCKLDVIHIDYDVAMRLAIALNELICNAIEHGLTTLELPELWVSVKQTDGMIELVVRDNGPGIQEQKIQSNSVKGQTLIAKLLRKVNGTITYSNENGCVATIGIGLKK